MRSVCTVLVNIGVFFIRIAILISGKGSIDVEVCSDEENYILEYFVMSVIVAVLVWFSCDIYIGIISC